ncbi:hypothetical protein GOBAR_DD04794 [Gossypium barbadense]|nr:hypothetical protein GOBAR_DD04794 [Gossypium barbadense]
MRLASVGINKPYVVDEWFIQWLEKVGVNLKFLHQLSILVTNNNAVSRRQAGIRWMHVPSLQAQCN